MIVTLTLNPAVDVHLSVDHLLPNYRLHSSEPHLEAGGGGINVAKAVQRLGGQVLALFPSGGTTGLTLQGLLETAHVPFQVIGIGNPVRQCFSITESATQQQFRFSTPGPTLTPTEATACLAHVETLPQPIDYLVVSGSLPLGLSTDFYAQIARIAHDRQIRLILDTCGEPLRAALTESVFMIKPNLGELARLVGVDTLEIDQIGEAATGLIRAGNCQIVVVSMGARGAMLVTTDRQDYVQAPPVKQVSTAHTGDCLVGGMVHALAQGQSYADMIRTGVACGTAATMNNMPLFDPADVKRLVGWFHQKPTVAPYEAPTVNAQQKEAIAV